MGFQNTSRGQIARAQAAASQRSGGMAVTGPDTIPGWVPPLAPAGQLQDRRITQTIAADSTAIPVAYGQVQIAGRVFAAHFDEATSTWTVGALFCVGEVGSVSVLLNGETPPDGVTVNTYTGTTSQTADALLFTAIPGYSDSLVYSHPSGALGICYAVIQYKNSVYPAFPQILGQIEGRKVYNPATETTAYTQVPALALRDLITSPHFGLGDGVNDTSVIAAADANTEDTDPVDGEQRRRIGLVLEQRRSTVDWVQVLATYAGCWAHKRGDTWVLVPDRPATTAAVLGVEDAQLDPPSLADAQQSPTVVRVIYTDKSESPWRDREAVAMLDGVSAGTVPRRESVIRLPGVDRYSQAKREAEERLRKLQRALLSGSGTVFDDSIGLELGDIIEINSHPLYPTHNLFRITEPPAITRPGRLRIRFSAYSADDYDDTKPAASWGAAGTIIGRLGDILDFGWVGGLTRPEDAARADPLVKNGDLTSGPQGWDTSGTIGSGVSIQETVDAYAGNHAIQITNTGTSDRFATNERRVLSQPGDAFIIRARYWVEATDDLSAIRIQLGLAHGAADLEPKDVFFTNLIAATDIPGIQAGYVDIWTTRVVIDGATWDTKFASARVGARASNLSRRVLIDDVRMIPLGPPEDVEPGPRGIVNSDFSLHAYGWISNTGLYPVPGEGSRYTVERPAGVTDVPLTGHNWLLSGSPFTAPDVDCINATRRPCVAGDEILFRVIYSTASGGGHTSGKWQAGLRWFNAAGGLISTSLVDIVAATADLTSSQLRADAKRKKNVFTAPAGTAWCQAVVVFDNCAGITLRVFDILTAQVG